MTGWLVELIGWMDGRTDGWKDGWVGRNKGGFFNPEKESVGGERGGERAREIERGD